MPALRTRKAARAFIRTVLRSLTDLRFFREARKRRVSEALGYLSVLLIITWLIPFSVDFFIGMRKVNDAVVSGLRENVPAETTFLMKDGRLTSNLQAPIFAEENGFTFIVNSASSSLELSEDRVGIAINQDAIVQREGANRVQVVSYANIPDFEIDRHGVDRWIAAFGPWIVLLVSFVAILAFSLALVVGFGLLVVLHAFIFGFLMRLLKLRMPYAQAFTVATYAATVPILVKAVADWIAVDIGSAPTYLYWILLGFIAYDFKKNDIHFVQEGTLSKAAKGREMPKKSGE